MKINFYYMKIIMYMMFMLISVAFITLNERKFLGLIQIRLGPQKIFFSGLSQSFSDVLKLFNKGILFKSNGFDFFMCSVSPVFCIFITLMFWINIPMLCGYSEPKLSFMFFLLCLSFNVYPLVWMGWFSNNKFSLLSCFRSLGQLISYELCLGLLVLGFMFLLFSLEISFLIKIKIYLYMPSMIILWIFSLLMELNRTPFDFSESESELVSGYLTEVGGFSFSFFFLCEYSMILFFSLLSSFLLFKNLSLSFIFFTLIILIRGLCPRTRYDKQMNLAWKVILPMVLLLSFSLYWIMIFFSNVHFHIMFLM